MFGIALDLEEFISTFIRRMRQHEKIRSPPSIRQGIALFKLLNSRFHRSPPLNMQDLLEAAIITTYYLDQHIASEIAQDIIISTLNERIADSREFRSYGTYENLLTLGNFGADYLKDIRVLDKLMKADPSVFQDTSKFLDEIYDAIKQDLSLQDLQFLEKRDKLEENLGDITDPELSMYANKLLGNDNQWKSQLGEIMQDLSKDLQKIFKNLNELGVSNDEIEQMKQEFCMDDKDGNSQFKNSSDSRDFSDSHSDSLTQQISDSIASNSLSQDSSRSELDPDQMDPMNFSQLKELMEKSTKIPPQSSWDSTKFKQALEEIRSAAKDLLQQSTTQEQFFEQLQEMMENLVPCDIQDIQDIANNLGVDPSHLDTILNQPLNNLHDLIEKNLGNMGQFSNMIQQLGPDSNMSRDLIQKGIEFQNSEFLGSMAQFSLEETANAVAKKNSDRLNALFLQGLRKASGDNLLHSWFFHQSKLSTSIRVLIKQFLQQLIIDKACFVVKHQMGKLKHGLMFSSQDLRYYRPGDPISQVDLEATFEHLLDQGKNLSTLNQNDILCRKEGGSSVKCFLILDKSGSMEGTKLKLATYSTAVLSSFLKREDFSIVLFDSDAYKFKTFTSHVDLDTIVSSLLDLSAEGGTQIEQTLNYVAQECAKCPANQKFLIFLFSDLAVYEQPAELKTILNQMQKYQIDIHLFHPENPNKLILQCLESILPVYVHHITSLSQIPQILTRAFHTALK
ncbi:hypothetical protein NEF87_003747 [Candidatus Lokiarchaeum ossiferum]|uniref:VWFA domain-containing protein n=1 Tax=Candidatus Lokiarchaeum ossiferum TaxID=2951803 RepID=A0ABY6HVB9_9ARCH|nr:hypothetical protein NEF87_003747 [Candidatus Lokiarchaeum sp. B-35]